MFKIDPITKSRITSSAYYHLKHYEDFGGNNDIDWIRKMNDTLSKAEGKLSDIILKQEKKENDLLNKIFQGEIPTLEELSLLGFPDDMAKTFINNYKIGKTGSSIEERILALNNIISSPSLSSLENTKSALEDAKNIICKAFEETANLEGIEFKNGIKNEQIFISALISVLEVLDKEIRGLKKDEIFLKEILSRPREKLSSAINFYIKKHKAKVEKQKRGIEKLEEIEKRFSPYIDTINSSKWGKKHSFYRDFNTVSATLKRSADGFLRQKGGNMYESVVGDSLLKDFDQIFNNTKVTVTEKGLKFVGLKKDKLTGRQQKGDIELFFSLTSNSGITEKINLTFSVKKKESGDFIQVHHGGSVFAYANRLNNMSEIDFSFLNDGNFQYVYVNELAKKDADFESNNFLKSFLELIHGFGWIFLGEEVSENIEGADFIYIQNKIFAFSTILKKIKIDPQKYLQVIVKQMKRPVLTEKAELLTKYPTDKYSLYNEGFIKDSIKIGKDAIYGTTFSVYLRNLNKT